MNDSTRRAVRLIAPFALATLAIVIQEGWGASHTASWPWSPPRVLGLTPAPVLDPMETTTLVADAMPDAPTHDVAMDSVSQLGNDMPQSTEPFRVSETDSTDSIEPDANGPSAYVQGHLTVPAGALTAFTASLDSLQRGTLSAVRVAHYGDSQIEGDRFTMHLRKALQEPVGSLGVGFVPIISEVAAFRVTVRHRFSQNWLQLDRSGKGAAQYGTGPAGLQFLPSATSPSTVSYKTLGMLSSIAIGLAPSTTPLRLHVAFSPLDSSRITVEPHTADTVLVIRPAAATRDVALTVIGEGALYGVWLQEGARGLAVDNYSRRGSAGDHLLDVAGCAVERDVTVGSTRLILLMFGINVLADSPGSYGWYGKRLHAVMATLRRCFPSSAVLVIGPALRGVQDPMGVRESRGTASLARALRQAAAEGGAAFWDQTEAMRQIAPFESWATSGMLAPDLAHYSDRAARLLGQQLASDLLTAFRQRNERGGKSQ